LWQHVIFALGTRLLVGLGLGWEKVGFRGHPFVAMKGRAQQVLKKKMQGEQAPVVVGQ
jgi:hypothetical protein